MTFLEAALELLKREGKPLHVRDLTKLAVKNNLLSVVGRDPETTMKTQLQAALRVHGELLQVRQDVYGLRSYPPRPAEGEAADSGQGSQTPAREASAKVKETRRKTSKGVDEQSTQATAGAPPRSARREQNKEPEAHAEARMESEQPSSQRRRRGGRSHAPDRAEAAPDATAPAATGVEPEPPVAKTAETTPPTTETPKTAETTPPTTETPKTAETTPPTTESAPPRPAPPVPSEPAPSKPPQEPPWRLMFMADAAFDVLRGSSEGRPIHFRQMVDIALKRRLVRGEAADLWRLMRAALVRDQRQRDSDGLRARVRNLGQGMYALADRKLEPELVSAEKELLDRLNRTREATRVALRRRLKAMPASAFELLMRLLLERLGMINAELIKRGEGVAYYAGTLNRGSRIGIKVLCAVRPGEAEVTPEAVGELRAGVRLRGFDEGLLLASGRASQAALAEVSAAPGIEMYDQEALTDLLIRHQLGVRRMHLPIDYLDLDLLGELLEPPQ